MKEYDSKDFITSWIEYDSASKIIRDEKYTYEFISNNKYNVTTHYSKSQSVKTITLNNNNKILSEVWADGGILSRNYTYNDKGQEILIVMKDSNGNFDHEFAFEYDEAGNIIQKKYKNNINYTSTETNTYIYDQNNNWTNKIGDGKSITEREIKYFQARGTRERRN